MYRALDVALLRAVVHTGTPEVRPWPDLDAGPTATTAWRSWMSHTWADPQLAEAVLLANPAYAARVEDIIDGRVDAPRAVRKAGGTLVRYLLRQRHRATPFGLFAGVVPVRAGHALEGTWNMDHRAIVRPDARWLAGVADLLERDPELLPRLPVTADQTCKVRGDHLVVPLRRPDHHQPVGAPTEVALRCTEPVRIAIDSARQPIRLGHLAELVLDAHPGAGPEQTHRMLAQLVHHGVLATALRPPMTCNPLEHVLDRLTEAEAESIPAVVGIVRLLGDIARRTTAHNVAPSRAQREERARLRELTGGADRPALAVDLQLGADLVIPHTVAREAETAAALLAQASPHPNGSPAWRDYQLRFLERYGIGALVPLLDLVNPDTGLGFPAGYRTSVLDLPIAPVTARDKQLVKAAQLAALDATDAIELSELLPGLGEQADHLPPHLDLCVRIHAASRQHLNDRDFRLVVTGLSQGAGTTIGRFLHLPHADLRRLSAQLRDVPTLSTDARRVQVSCPPLWADTDNVARTPRVLDDVIAVAEHAQGTLPLRDLLVTSDARRMRLLSRASGQVIEPAVFNAVEAVNFAHPLARFLTELPRARAAVLVPFSWGTLAEALPVLPAVRHGRIILATARWRLNAADLPARGQNPAEWERAFDGVRHRLRIPTYVDLGNGDQRLRLDLDQRSHRQLLRAQLERSGRTVLRQAPGPNDLGWADGRATEIVLPLVCLQKPHRPAAVDLGAVATALSGEQPADPRSRWAYAKVYAQPVRHSAILARLPELLATLAGPDCWFVPYRDPEPHLRLRIRQSGPFDCLARRTAAWTSALRAAGLVTGRLQWDTYQPETGRYGTGLLLELAEAVFVADSTAALAQQRHTGPGRLSRQALTAASFIDLAAAFTGDTGTGAAWLAERITRTDGAPCLDRAVLAQTLHLADPDDARAGLRAETGTEIIRAWEIRRTAVHAYRAALRTHTGPDPDSVLASLLHMHHIRAAGIDQDSERDCHRLSRATALALTHRHQGSRPR
ncbi:lantibiotic dehydratase [Kitasatospora sp. NPDC001547]|uniref:lantibiotic dehydratase n=1 Tax=Kitasatospora sp. NPDC001547 TaxID=3364015 RepID=UPI00368CA759|nr:lantibiotic dehydratase [Kitasatospora sp. Xyl93]